jgi:hypothetical protein
MTQCHIPDDSNSNRHCCDDINLTGNMPLYQIITVRGLTNFRYFLNCGLLDFFCGLLYAAVSIYTALSNGRVTDI